MSDPGAEEIPLAAAPRRAPDRSRSRAARRTEAARMITVLADALAGRFAELDEAAEPLPRGWWFSPDTRR